MKLSFMLLITMSLIMVVSSFVAVYAQQGVYVSPPSLGVCWRNWTNIGGAYFVFVDTANISYSVYVFTPSQYQEWMHNGAYAMMNFTVRPGEIYTLHLPNGTYTFVAYLVPCSYNGLVGVVMNYTAGYPVGVSSLGPVNTTQVLGFFNITSISAHTQGVSGYIGNTVSLQLNVYLAANLSTGVTQYYVLQNVLELLTSSYGDLGSVADNVWNVTSLTAVLSNYTITGSGHVASRNNMTAYMYSELIGYFMPTFTGYLLIKLVSVNPLIVQFCFVTIQQNITYYPPNFNCFDTVTIHTYAPVVNASIIARPLPSIPVNYAPPMDTEFVFGGFGNGTSATFNTINAYLALLYWNGSAWVVFPNLYSVGMNTLETVTNLESTLMPTGLIHVTVGQLPQGSALLTVKPPTPLLPMTFVETSVIGAYLVNITGLVPLSEYVFKPLIYTVPTTINIMPGVEYVLTKLLINGEPTSNYTIVIRPSTNFTAYIIQPSYAVYYLINVTSPVPVMVKTYNETVTTTTFTEWVPPVTTLSVEVPRYYYLSNGTKLIYQGSNETITVAGPLILNITEFAMQYLVSVRSQYPVYINGALTMNYTAWLNPGAMLSIAPRTVFVNGVFMSEPGYSLTVKGPINLVIQWSINWALTGALYGVIVIIVITVSLVVAKRLRK